MDGSHPDLETGTMLNIPRHINKKMRKRRHLDALLKFRSVRKTSNDIVRSSEDELFIPQQQSTITRSRTSVYHRCWFYSKYILSFSFICIIITICIALISTNIELKNETRHLASRIAQIEEKFTNIHLNNLSSIIKQIEIRLEPLEQLNISLINDLIQSKSIKSSNRMNSQDNFNQTIEIYLMNLVHNLSDKTSTILNELQMNLNKLHNQLDQCQCLKSIPLKPSIVDSNQLQQSLITKPNVLTPLITTTSTHRTVVINENQIRNLTDTEQIVNQPSII